jgi:hypothetical protein
MAGTAYEFNLPVVTAITLSPNPADVTSPVEITVNATMETITLYSEEQYSGEYQSGEV